MSPMREETIATLDTDFTYSGLPKNTQLDVARDVVKLIETFERRNKVILLMYRSSRVFNKTTNPIEARNT